MTKIKYKVFVSSSCPACEAVKDYLREICSKTSCTIFNVENQAGLSEALKENVTGVPTVIDTATGKRYVGVDEIRRLRDVLKKRDEDPPSD